jgi:hypothetical protein
VHRRTIVATIGRVVERVALLTVVFSGRSSGLAHLLLAVALEVDLVHGVGWVAQVRHDRQGARLSGGYGDQTAQANQSWGAALCRKCMRSAQ